MDATPQDRGVDFEIARLDEFLRGRFGGAEPTEVERTQGGMSNPTYFLTRGDWRAVLRKQPNAALMPSAHAIDREYRVLAALRNSSVPTPEPYLYCDDRAVIGTPFYLMERFDGRVFHEFRTPGLNREERAQSYRSMCATLASIHKLDFRALGLGDFGKPGNYFARQLKRWSSQWTQFRRDDDDNPDLDNIVRWLSERVPDSETIALCHGDYRIANVIFHATEPRVIGVLDWELATLGHPLADVAYNCMIWHLDPATPNLSGLAGRDLAVLGIPSEADYLAGYAVNAQLGQIENYSFFLSFAFFRFASIAQGVYARALAGNASAPNALQVGLLAAPLAELGWKTAHT